MIKVAFVNSPIGESFERRGSIPIGLAYIMAYLRANGVESHGFDLSNSSMRADRLVDLHALNEFDVVGFSVYNESFAPTISMARRIKELNPGTFVVCGGPQATATHAEILSRYADIDAVIRKEGEQPTLALLGALTRGDSLAEVPNLTFRRGSAVVINDEMSALEDLDSLPFPDVGFASETPYPALMYYDQERAQNVPALTVCSSRSCPYNCSFCGVLTIGRRYRSRSPENVVAEVDHFRRTTGTDFRHIYFSDANFFVQPQRALEIVEALRAYDARITFSFGTRVNQLLKADSVVEKMLDDGLKFIEVGIESASPSVLERLAKGVSPEVNSAAVRMLRRLGVEIALDLIMLDPASTLDDVELNLEFLRSNGFVDYFPVDHLYTSLGLYEGTPIRDFYADRLNMEFQFGELPDIDELFELEAVRQFWRITQDFRRSYQEDIDRRLGELELLLLNPRVRSLLMSHDGADFQNLRKIQLDAVALRHAAIRFFEQALTHVREGRRPTCAAVLEHLTFGTPPTDIATLLHGAEGHREWLKQRFGEHPTVPAG